MTQSATAGLDVFEAEPDIPKELRENDKITILRTSLVSSVQILSAYIECVRWKQPI